MTDEKEFQQELSTIWDTLRHERRARRKLTDAADLVQASEVVAGLATALANLAKRAATSPAPSPPAKTAKKRKAKKSGKSRAKTKAKRKQ